MVLQEKIKKTKIIVYIIKKHIICTYNRRMEDYYEKNKRKKTNK